MQTLIRGLRRLNDNLKRSTHVYMVIVAAGIGILAGYGAVGFRLLIQFLQSQFWQTSEYSIQWVSDLPWYWVVLAPAGGGLIVGTIVARFAPEAKGHGVPEVMESVVLHQGRIRPRVVVAKALASGVSIASGGSVGREGPIVQIGAAIGSTAGQALGVRPRRMRTMVACGTAGGIAATFNAPVAGALFAVEVLLGDFGVPQFSPVVISSVMATVVSHAYLGDLPAFEIPTYSLEHPLELVAYVALGVLACFVALAFIRSLYATEDLFDRVRLPLPLKAALGGAIVGGIGLVFPGILGVGYEQINEALMGTPEVWLLGALVLAKLVAVSVTIGSGGSGGGFAPSLFLGAMLGGTVGRIMSFGFPGQVAEPGAYALVGMGAVVAAATHAPITAIVILFELTSDYRIILPLMLACIISTLMATRLYPESIYTLKLSRRGVQFRRGQDLNLLKKVPVSEIMRRDVPTIEPDTHLLPLVEKVSLGQESCYYILGEDNHLEGVLSFSELKPYIKDSSLLNHLIIASDVAEQSWPAIAPSDTLDSVLRQLDLGYREELPVVEDGVFVGAIRMEDVLQRYRRELFRHEMAESVASSMSTSSEVATIHRVGEHALSEVEAPPSMYGRTLAEIDLRGSYGVNVLLIKADSEAVEAEPQAPTAGYRIRAGDRLVVFGTQEGIGRLARS